VNFLSSYRAQNVQSAEQPVHKLSNL